MAYMSLGGPRQWLSTQPVNQPGSGSRQPQFNALNGYQGQQQSQPNWWTGTDPIRTVEEQYKPFYTNEDPRAFWGQVGQQVTGGNDFFRDYWNRNYDKYQQQFLRASEGKPDAQFPDWVTGNVAGQVQQGFLLQDARQRGIDSRLYDRGRFDTSY